MFSMTDIKAHTVYKIVMFVPNLILVALSIFAYPFASYIVGFSFVDSVVLKVSLSIAAFFILGLIWAYLVKAISFVLNEIFYLLIDVTPSRGLSSEESKAVLFGGQAVLDHIEFDKNVRNISHEVVDRMSRQGLFGLFFQNAVSKRLWAISNYYQENPKEAVSGYTAKKVLKDLGIDQPWHESTLNNPYIRNMALQFMFFLYLLCYQPHF